MAHKLLIVDDTETMRLFIKMLLEEQGYDISVARDGVEALMMVTQEKPDLVLLDIMMPRMNGIEVCREIKSDALTQDIKVMMITTKTEVSQINEAFAVGCDDYVTKPIDREELQEKVKELLQLRDVMRFLKT